MILRSLVEKGFFLVRKRPIQIDPLVDDRMLFEIATRRFSELLRGALLGLRHLKPMLVFAGRGVRIQFASRVTVGRWTTIGDLVVLDGFGKNGLRIGSGCSIGAYSRVIASSNLKWLGEGIEFADGVTIGEFSRLGGSGGLTVGRNTIMGQYLTVHPENHLYDDPTRPIREQGTVRKAVRIGQNCWMGSKVTILAGVEIGDNCVVGAGTVVTRSFPSNSIIVGVPAKVVGTVPSAQAAQPS